MLSNKTPPRIVTLTLNPAIDLACIAQSVVPVHKIRTTAEQFDAGGGGINIARVLRTLGVDALAILMAGGATGQFLRELLDEKGLEYLVIPILGRTRISLAVHESSTGREFRFVPAGPMVAEAELHALLEVLEKIESEWLVASGSLPEGAPADFYGTLARFAVGRGMNFVLDTTGVALKHALGQGITLIKPSLGELENLVGRTIRDRREQEAAALALVREGAAQFVVLSLGAEGAILAQDKGVLSLPAPNVVVRSSVGAGDSFTAGMILGLSRGDAPEDAFARGIAAGAAAVMNYGTAHLLATDVETLYRQIVLPTP
jgi:6-phosphofructokinase 2